MRRLSITARLVAACVLLLAGAAATFGAGLVVGLIVEPGQVNRLSRVQDRILGSRVAKLAKPDAAPALPWRSHAATERSTRYSAAAQINRDNVGTLQVAWIHPTGDNSGQQRTTPVVVDSTLYYTAGATTAIAVSAADGREIWRYHHEPSKPPRSCCGLASRGVAADSARVYLATIDARLMALDRGTGKKLWEAAIADPDSGYTVRMAPLLAENLVVVGASGGEYGIRGFVDAFDTGTGERRWRFWTVPSPAEGGWWGNWVTRTPDGDTLSRDIVREKRDSARYADAWKRGGGSVWITPSYDASLRTLYIGVGNPAPVFSGRARPGDNLYTSSIVALDIASGTRKWHYQVAPHDETDRDIAAPIVLFDQRAGDSAVPALAQANKTGWVYVLDRRTGRRLLRSEALVPQRNVFAASVPEGTEVYPGPGGGPDVTPPAYSPRTGLLYVSMPHAPRVVYAGGEADTFALGQLYLAGGMKRPEGLRSDPWQAISAVDLRTGAIRWQRRERGTRGGGMMATAGDLAFYTIKDEVRALDAATGRTLWRFRCDDKVSGPPMTYVVGGRQYVVVATNTTMFAFALPDR